MTLTQRKESNGESKMKQERVRSKKERVKKKKSRERKWISFVVLGHFLIQLHIYCLKFMS